MTHENDPASPHEFIAAARDALRTSSGPIALDRLGWFDLLREMDDRDARHAVFALFRAQGRELASSGAFGALLAQPYAAIDADVDRAFAAGSLAATVNRRSARHGDVVLLVGEPPTGALLVDRPGRGAVIVAVDAVQLRPIDLPGRLALHEVSGGVDARSPTMTERDTARARRRSTALGRIAASCEMLGAAEGALAAALDHAIVREQFGKPIASFQAVRHLLAWARTECEAVDAVVDHAVSLDREAPRSFDAFVKGLAGRNARRVCERTLQVLGAIGFTAEHPHHHFHSRVLAFDSVFGTSASLTASIGAEWREDRIDPCIPATLLGMGDSA